MGEKIRFSWKLWAVSFALWTAYSLLYSGSWSLWLRSAGRPQPYWSNHIFFPLLNHWINELLTPLVLVFALRHSILREKCHVLVVRHFAGMLLFIGAHMAIRLARCPLRDHFTVEIVP